MFENNNDKPSLIQTVTLVSTLLTTMVHTLVDCFASQTLTICVSKSYTPNKGNHYIVILAITQLNCKTDKNI